MRFIDPEHTYNALHERSVRAAEQHEIEVAVQRCKDRKRAERRATSQPAGPRYRRLFSRRTSPIHP